MNISITVPTLGKDPELRKSQSGKDVCTFSGAVKRTYKNANGDYDSDWFNYVVWNELAIRCAKYLRKGSQCVIKGKMQNRSYEAKDGTKRYITEIIAEEVQFLRTGEKATTGEPTQVDMVETSDEMPF